MLRVICGNGETIEIKIQVGTTTMGEIRRKIWQKTGIPFVERIGAPKCQKLKYKHTLLDEMSDSTIGNFAYGDVIHLLEEKAVENSSFHVSYLYCAVQHGEVEPAKLLIENSESPEREIALKEKVFKETALHIASSYRHLEITEMLIGIGANCNALDFRGRTPLDFAVFYGFEAEMNALACGGCEMESPSRNPIAIASSHSKYFCVLGSLIEHGAGHANLLETTKNFGTDWLEMCGIEFSSEKRGK